MRDDGLLRGDTSADPMKQQRVPQFFRDRKRCLLCEGHLPYLRVPEPKAKAVPKTAAGECHTGNDPGGSQPSAASATSALSLEPPGAASARQCLLETQALAESPDLS